MRPSVLLPAAGLASALALGCAEQQSPTGPAADPSAPSLGAVRIRPVSGFVILGADVSTSLVVQVGWEPGITAEDLCANFTGGVQDAGQKGQLVLTPPGGGHVLTSGRDANIVVYQYGGGIVTDICSQLVGAPIVGTGTGKFRFLIQDSGPGATVVHATVQGTIDLATGGQARVFGTARVTILPDGPQLFDEERVRLTPL